MDHSSLISPSLTSEDFLIDHCSSNEQKFSNFFTNHIDSKFIENITGDYSFTKQNLFKNFIHNPNGYISTKFDFRENNNFYSNIIHSLNSSNNDFDKGK
jgi:hypothetical protein